MAPRERAVRICKAKSKRRSKKRGGWHETSGIPTKDVYAIIDGIHRLKSGKTPLNTFVTVRPDSAITGDAERKRFCTVVLDNQRRKFKRRGLRFIALIVFEKPSEGQLHVHMLLHVPETMRATVEQWRSLPEIDIRPRVPKHESYIVKNRLPAPPEREKFVRTQLPRKPGAKIKGKRWRWSSDAIDVLAAE